MYSVFQLGNLKVRDYLQFLDEVDQRMILKWILRRYIERAWTGFIWLKRGTIVGLL